MRLILSCTGVLVVGVTSVAREREFDLVVRCLRWPPPRLSYSACLRSSPSPYVRVCFLRLSVRPPPPPRRKALDIPFYRYKRCPAIQWGCSYALTWLAEECLEPCTCANVAIGEVP
jgi:hypothetical protein